MESMAKLLILMDANFIIKQMEKPPPRDGILMGGRGEIGREDREGYKSYVERSGRKGSMGGGGKWVGGRGRREKG